MCQAQIDFIRSVTSNLGCQNKNQEKSKIHKNGLIYSLSLKMVVFRKDPCGIVCLAMTYGAVFYADYVVINWIVLQVMPESYWGLFHILAFNTVVLMLFSSHARAVFSDPGIVPLPQNRMDFSDFHDEAGEPLTQNQPPDEDWTICTRCEMYRPPRAHHCRICRRCIRRMDHHCPWINNCVGEWNQKYFIQFLFYVAILSAYSLFLVGFSWYYHGSDSKSSGVPINREMMQIKQSRILHSVLLVLESILFGLFVSAIGKKNDLCSRVSVSIWFLFYSM